MLVIYLVKIHLHFHIEFFQNILDSPESLLNLQENEWNYPIKQINNGNITEEIK